MPVFIDRLKLTGLPLDQIVVIGSGLLDVLGLRPAADIDVVVSGELFARLKQDPTLTLGRQNNSDVLEKDTLQIWPDWPPFSYADLMENALVIDAVAFMNPDFLIQKKQARGSAKDLADVELLKEYLQHER